MTLADQIQVRPCTSCGHVAHTMPFTTHNLFTSFTAVSWVCQSCCLVHWSWCYLTVEQQQHLLAAYADAAERDALERWLSWTFGETRYTALCQEVVTL